MSNEKNSNKGIILIVHALVWAGAMLGGTILFKGHAWSEDLFMWMVAGFVLVNGLLMTALGRSRPRC